MKLGGKQAYLFAMYGNQMELVDSCRIADNAFRLSGEIPQDEVMGEVMIPHEATFYLLIAKGEKIKMHIDATTRSFFPKSEGSFATARMNHLSKRYRAIGYGHLDSLRQVLQDLPEEDARRRDVADSIRLYEQELSGLVRDAVNNRQSILLAMVAKSWYLDSNPGVATDSMERVVKSISEHFPNNVHLPTVDRRLKQPRPSQSSIDAFNRKARLAGQPLPYPDGKDTREEPVKTPDAEFPAYQPGDTVAAFSLPDRDGKKIDLGDIASEYILIDFWASWCPPCREEMPRIATVKDNYGDRLTVYAISLDKETDAWKKAVEELSLSHFVNVRLSSKDERFRELVSRFDVKAIPHNFLLNKERRIIAIDLNGNELAEKIKERSRADVAHN